MTQTNDEKKQVNAIIEKFRIFGKNKGFWSHGFGYKRHCSQLFQKVELKDKSLLEIGCGKGLLCVWGEIQGAHPVVGLEPFEEGSGSFDPTECFKDFTEINEHLNLQNTKLLPCTIQDYDCPDNYFDVILSVNSVNHLSEDECVTLRENKDSRETYLAIFKELHRIMKKDGVLIVSDVSGNNLFGDLGITNPFLPTIEWNKHQAPEFWAELLSEAGFVEPKISWLSGSLSRYLGIFTMNRALSYCKDSMFRLEMRCAK